MNIFKDTMSEMTYKQIEKMVSGKCRGQKSYSGWLCRGAGKQSIYQKPIKRGRQADGKGHIKISVNRDTVFV